MAAADKRLLAFGSLVSVDGYHQGKPVPVLDRGGAIKGHHIDLLMPTDAMARKWGKRTMTVTIWDYAD
jgi:3D (Asp-Asp-Asp) domain-containing protein